MTIFKYRFLSIIRNKAVLFWNLGFPLVLVTFFGLSLPNAYKTIEYETIPIAVINDHVLSDPYFHQTLTALEEGDHPLLHVTYTTKEEAGSLLANNEIEGIIEEQDGLHLYVNGTGIKQTILQSFLDEYTQTSSMIQHLIQQGASMDQIMENMQNTQQYLRINEEEHHDVSSIFFYSIIAMCCLYGGYISMNSVHSIQANQTPLGARNAVAPLKKSKMLCMDFIISYGIGFVILMILLAYMMFGLHVSFGEHFGYIIISVAVSILSGNSIGILIGVAITKDKGFKTGLITAVTLFLSMLSGMMFVQMKYFMDTYLPLVSRINPANMITDSLYALYYYGPGVRYYSDLIAIMIFSVICYAISFMIIRRKQYASL